VNYKSEGKYNKFDILSSLSPYSSHTRVILEMGGISQRIRTYTREDVETHKNTSSCWVLRRGKVYDITAFLKDHPGGDDVILNIAGRDVEEIMRDATRHVHSDSAYEMLEEYVIGRLGTDHTTVRDGA